MRLAVHDGNPTRSAGAGDVACDAESGRGLGILDALVDEVTVGQIADDGKIIQAAFGIRPPDPA